MKGDVLSNWTFFKDQWENYEVATGLSEKSKNVRVATLISVVSRDCFRILKNLEITDADCKDPAKCIKALESYFKPTQNEIYEYCISGFFRGYLSSRMYTVGLVRENLFSR